MNLNKLEKLSKLSFKDIDKNSLQDINDFLINPSLSLEERIKVFLDNTENPYILKCGDYVVKFSFSDNDLRINECFYRYLNQCLDERL